MTRTGSNNFSDAVDVDVDFVVVVVLVTLDFDALPGPFNKVVVPFVLVVFAAVVFASVMRFSRSSRRFFASLARRSRRVAFSLSRFVLRG